MNKGEVMKLILSDICFGVGRESWWKNVQTLHFLPKIMSPKDWDTNKKLLPSPEGAMHTKFGKDWPSRFWEKDDKGRRTTDNERRRRPTHSIGHLSDSGDLKYLMFWFWKYRITRAVLTQGQLLHIYRQHRWSLTFHKWV